MKPPHGKKYFANVIELNDNTGKNFYAYDDPDMVWWLGRPSFIHLLRFNPTTLVEEHKVGDNNNLRLFNCTMMHTRYKAACLYTEPKYERLAVEAHIESKTTTRGKEALYDVLVSVFHSENRWRVQISPSKPRRQTPPPHQGLQRQQLRLRDCGGRQRHCGRSM